MSRHQSLKAGGTLPSARLQPAGSTRVLLRESDGGVVKRTVLPGGLRIITEQVPNARSASVGIWAGVGSRDETPVMAGSAHFLEHLLFKATRQRDAMQISAPIEAVGGDMNAFTTKEYTAYYARVLGEDLHIAVEILADMLQHSLIQPVDFQSERQVILEEIAMRDDDHADSAHEAFVQAMYGDADLGRPILGTVASIKAAQRDQVWKFYRKHYTPNRLVIAAAGAVDHRELVAQIKRHFADSIGGSRLPVERRKPHGSRPAQSQLALVPRKTEQSHLVLGVPAFARGDDRRFTVGVMNAVLGGGMSSRLFQEVRERRGLAYSVYSFVQTFADTGYLGIYSGSIPSRLADALNVIDEIRADLRSSGVTNEELDRGRGQLRGSLLLGMEDSGARMTRIAKAELVSGELLSMDRTLELIESVTAEDVSQVAGLLFAQQPTIGVVGPYKNRTEFRKRMQRKVN